MRCLVILLFQILLFAPAFAVSGWETALKVEVIDDMKVDEASEVASLRESSTSLESAYFSRSRSGQLGINFGVSWMDADWSGNPLADTEGSLYGSGERLYLSGLWTRAGTGPLGYSIFTGVESARAEDGVFKSVGLADAISFRFGTSLNYRTEAGVVIGVGFLYRSPIIETDRDWLPIVQIYWRINEQWTLQTRNGVVLTWRENKQERRTFEVSVLWNSQEWHIGEMAGQEFSIEREGLSLGIGSGWKVGAVRIEPSIRYTVAAETTIWTQAGRVFEADLDSYLSGSVVLTYTF